MNTKFDMNQKVRLVGAISGIHTDERGTKYVISVNDGCSGYDGRICITEKMLTEMNKEDFVAYGPLPERSE